jgi:hypothetical protein
LRTGATRCVFLADGDVDEVFGAQIIALLRRIALIDVAGAVLVVMVRVLQKRYGAARIEVSDVGFGIQILLRDVAVVRCFHPVPSMFQQELCAQNDMYGLRIVDYNLSLCCPAGKFDVRFLGQICYCAACNSGAYVALGFVLERRVLDGEVLLFRVGTAVF